MNLDLPPNVFSCRRLFNCTKNIRTVLNHRRIRIRLKISMVKYLFFSVWHGRCGFKTAKANKWINEDEPLEDCFYLSDLILLRDDNIHR